MIYIDPPYNTGKDFVYKDNFSKDTQEELYWERTKGRIQPAFGSQPRKLQDAIIQIG